jgi:hypothetical protein
MYNKDDKEREETARTRDNNFLAELSKQEPPLFFCPL